MLYDIMLLIYLQLLTKSIGFNDLLTIYTSLTNLNHASKP